MNRLDKSEVERLIRSTYQSHSKYGLMIKTLFLVEPGSTNSCTSIDDLHLITTRHRSTSATARRNRIVMCQFCRHWRRNCGCI